MKAHIGLLYLGHILRHDVKELKICHGHSSDKTHVIIICRCGHCKKLAPEYEKLGSSFKKSKSVLIAKVCSRK